MKKIKAGNFVCAKGNFFLERGCERQYLTMDKIYEIIDADDEWFFIINDEGDWHGFHIKRKDEFFKTRIFN